MEMVGRATTGGGNSRSSTVRFKPGHRHQGFARAGLAHECDELDAVVEQRVEGVMLLAVARLMPRRLRGSQLLEQVLSRSRQLL